MNYLFQNQSKTFRVDTYSRVTEEPQLAQAATAAVYQQILDGGATSNSLVLGPTALTPEDGYVPFTVDSGLTGTEGDYVVVWIIDLPGVDSIEKETRFHVLIQPRFSIPEGLLLDALRVHLGDYKPEEYRTDPQVVRWEDAELYIFLQYALADINLTPPMETNFTFDSLPQNWNQLVVVGSVIFSLISHGIFEVGRDFSYNDNGLSVSLDRSGKFFSAASTLLTNYSQWKVQVKRRYAFATTRFTGMKEQRMPISIRRPLSMLPHLGNVFGRGGSSL